MILRRISEQVRKQQWTAIAIEFVIVVLGVFLGLQVENWNQGRLESERELEMLGRLAEEFNAVEADLVQVVEQFARTERSTATVIGAIRLGRPDADEQAFKNALRDTQYVWDAPSLSVTYTELVGTGALSRLADPELRHALTRYGDFAARYDRKLPVALAVVLDPNSRFLQATEWSADPDDWSTSDAILRYDWEGLVLAHAELQSWQAFHKDLSEYVTGQLGEVRTVLERLEAAQ